MVVLKEARKALLNGLEESQGLVSVRKILMIFVLNIGRSEARLGRMTMLVKRAEKARADPTFL